jgi:hypothetical protein
MFEKVCKMACERCQRRWRERRQSALQCCFLVNSGLSGHRLRTVRRLIIWEQSCWTNFVQVDEVERLKGPCLVLVIE